MILFLFIVALIFVMAVLTLSNTDPAAFFFFSRALEIPKAIVICLSLLAGVFLTSIWQSIQTISSKKIYRQFGIKIQEMEKDLKEKEDIIRQLQEKKEPAKQNCNGRGKE